jgi:hypothetical protein
LKIASGRPGELDFRTSRTPNFGETSRKNGKELSKTLENEQYIPREV